MNGKKADLSYNDLARRNGSGLCRDATMLMDSDGLIAPIRRNVEAPHAAHDQPEYGIGTKDPMP
jgi:hypothetical protein